MSSLRIHHLVKYRLCPGHLEARTHLRPETRACTPCKNLASCTFRIPSLQRRKRGFFPPCLWSTKDSWPILSAFFSFSRKRKGLAGSLKKGVTYLHSPSQRLALEVEVKPTHRYVGKYRGCKSHFQTLHVTTCLATVHLRKRENKFTRGFLPLIKCFLSQWGRVIRSTPLPRKKDIRLFGNCWQQSLPHTGGHWRKSQWNVSGTLSHCPAAARVDSFGPQDKPGPPRGARPCGGDLPPPPPSSGPRHTLGHSAPALHEHAAGMKVRRSLGDLHPQGLLFPEEERVSFICSGHQGWGAGRRWRTARVCKPIQGRMGTGAPGGSRRRASEDRLPLPRSPDQPSRSGFHLPEDKPFGSCSGSVRSSLPPSERASVFAATSPKVQGKCGPCRTHLSLFPPPPSV